MSKMGISPIVSSLLLLLIVFAYSFTIYNSTKTLTEVLNEQTKSSSDTLIHEIKEWSGASSVEPQNHNPQAVSLDGTVEGCYLGLEINETKIGEVLDGDGNVISQDIEFELLNQENLYGAYESSVKNYNPETSSDYVLITYDSNGYLLSNYSVYSGRFVFYDDFGDESEEPSGGVLELDSAVLFEIIPYDERIASIKINNSGVITDLGVNSGEFECVRTCKIAGEALSEGDSCCIGFVAGQSGDSYVCVNPNDGVCSEFEDADSCIGDCYNSTRCLYEGCMNFSCFNDSVRNVSSCECMLKPILNDCFNIAENPIKICSCSDLQRMKEKLNGNYELQNDIDCSETKTWNGGKGFEPVGNSSKQFAGNFDGKKHIISNLYIFNPVLDYVGLIGYVDSHNISNVGIVNINITGKRFVGGLVGYSNLRAVISNSYSTGDLMGVGSFGGVGGLIGYASTVTINDSYSSVKVSSTGDSIGIGGLIGYFFGSITNSYSTGNVSGLSYVGGLVGYFSGGQIINSYSTGNVSGQSYLGGLSGRSGTITNSYWYNSQENCYSGGNLGCTKATAVSDFYNGNDPTNVWDINIWEFHGDKLPTLKGQG